MRQFLSSYSHWFENKHSVVSFLPTGSDPVEGADHQTKENHPKVRGQGG